MTKTTESGYCPCACRDCMEIAIGVPGDAMCHECERAGCDGETECEAPGAYGGEPEPESMRQPINPCRPGCPGWAIFNEHEGRPSIQRCDECWAGVDGAPDDCDFEQHPEAIAALAAARKRLEGYETEEGIEECEDNACTGCAWCDAVVPPASRIADLCRTEGSYPIARLTEDPADVLPRLLAVLHELAPAPVAVPAIPAAALTDGAHPAWNGGIGEAALLIIMQALNAHAPEGFVVILDGDSIGFYPVAGEGV